MKSVALVVWMILYSTPSPGPEPPAADPPRVTAATTMAPAPPVQVQNVKRWTVRWLTRPTYTFLGIIWSGHLVPYLGGACPDYLTCAGGQSGVLAPDGGPKVAPSEVQVLDLGKDGHVFVKGGLHGFADADGKVLVEPKYERLLRQGDAFFEARSKADGNLLLTRDGRVVLSGFEEVSFEQEERIWVLRGGRWSLHDLAGRPIGAKKYRELDVVGERTAAVKVGNRWALVDVSGRQLTPLRYSGLGLSVNGYLPFNEGGRCEEGFDSCEGGRYGVLREDGRVALPAEHDCVEVLGIGEDDVEFRVIDSPAGLEADALQVDRCSGGRVRVLKKDGTPRFPDSFAFLDELDGATHLRAVKNGSCDFQGNCESGRWGVIDLAGRLVVDYRYDYIDPLKADGTLFVLDGKWGVLDGAFRESIPAKYEMLHRDKDAMRFLENRKWGILDRAGSPVVPARFEVLLPFVKGVARFQENGKWGLVASTGKILVPAKHLAICRPYLDTHVFADRGKCEVKSGTEVYDPTIVAAGVRLRRTGWANPDCECQEASLGLMDAAGKVLFPPKYQAIHVQSSVQLSERREGRNYFMGGFLGLPAGQAWVRLNQGAKCTRAGICVGGRWGLGTLKGRVVIPVEHAFLDALAGLLVRVAKGGTCETQNGAPKKCAPETRWGLIRLEPGK